MLFTRSRALLRGQSRNCYSRRPSRRQLRFEAMEARRLLAVYVVDTFEDLAGGFCAPDNEQGNDDCTLRAAIIAANANPGVDEIRLPAGTYTRDALLDRLQISDSLTITGLGAGPDDVIIDAGGTNGFSVFSDVSPAPLIVARFENLTIQNGFDIEEGGGILAEVNTRVEVIRSIIQDNTVSDASFAFAGGGIFTQGSLVIEDSIIRRNRVEEGPGGGVAFFGGAGNELVIRNSTFESNDATFEGGGLYAEGAFGASVRIENVLFEQNTSGFAGGGAYIYLVGTVNVSDSRFVGNVAGEDGGGGLYLLDTGPVLIAGSTFDGNVATGGGGGGLALLTDAEIEDSVFENNRVTRPAFAFDEGGGGIAIAQDFGFQPTISISRSIIRNNEAPLGGGIGSANANLTISESSIVGNRALNSFGGGGGIGFAQDERGDLSERVTLTVSNSLIDGNSSVADAGGIGIADADALIVQSSILNNSAAERGGGVGIIGFNNSPALRLEASTLAFNTAGGDGGGLAAVDAGIDLLNVTISNNDAGGSGGGIAYANTDQEVNGFIAFTTIASNRSAALGSNVASSVLPLFFESALVADPRSAGGPAFNFAAAPGAVVSLGTNLDSDSSSGFAQPGDLVSVDPLLGPLADNGGPVLTHALLAGSPALDAGALRLLADDARGLPRPVDGNSDGTPRNDIGAYESQEPGPVLLSLGDLVFLDVNNTGLFDPSIDSGIAGVSLSLFRDANGNGTLDETDPLIASTVTDAEGRYLFTGLPAGDYIVLIDAANFQNGGALVDRVPSTANQPAPDPNNNVDGDNNGFFIAGLGVVSGAINLAPRMEPGPPDFNANPTLDFGFVSNPLTAVDDLVQTPQIPVLIDALANDFDIVGSGLSIAAVEPPASGTAEIVGNQIRYVPEVGTTGSVTFQYTVVNEFGQQASALLTVEITAPPITAADDFATTPPVPIPIVIDVLANDSDSLGDALSIAAVETPTSGTAEIVDNQIRYLPDPAFTGSIAFQYTIVNEFGHQASALINVEITAPTITALDDVVETPQLPILIDVLTNDFDTLGSTLSIAAVEPPASGTAEIVGDQIRYVPAPGFIGSVTFSYTIANELGHQDTAFLTVEVTPAAADVADLAVSISAVPRGEVAPGQVVDFTVVVQNLSTTAATGVVVATTLSENLIFQSAASDVGTLQQEGDVVTFVGFSLPGGASETFTITAQINPSAPLPLAEFASSEVSADTVDPFTDNNFDSVDVIATSAALHRLSTGSDDGGFVIDVDAFGGFGTTRFFEPSLAHYNPTGPLPAAAAVFQSYLAVRQGPGPRAILESNSGFVVEAPVSGTDRVATSRFRFADFVIELTQRAEETFDAQGNRLGSRLVQSYTVTNVGTSLQLLDLVRYVDADLLFDGSLIDGGGVLTSADGSLLLFTTDRGGSGATDTTFVGISASGGDALSPGLFELDDFLLLENRILGGESLRDQIAGDTSGDGFVDPGREYDVAMALRNFLMLGPGQTLTYVATTLFGTRPDTVAPPQPAGDLVGNVFCDANGNGIQDSGEAMAGVTVFIDLNGNRILDTGGPNPEPFAITNSQGQYRFTGLGLPAGSTANVVVQNPPGCFPDAQEIGVTRVALPTGNLSRAIEAVDLRGTGRLDLIVANDLSNDLTVLNNDGGSFSVGATIPLGNRPQSMAVWHGYGETPPVVAVAAIGTPQNGGLVYVIENGSVRSFPSGDGPISVAADDFNGDGLPDFVTASFRSGTVVGRFSGDNQERVLANIDSARAVASGFINGDWAADLVVLSSGFARDDAFEVVVLLNDGSGNFTPLRQRITGRGGVDIALADFTGDGREEIVIASYDGSVRIFAYSETSASLQLIDTLRTEVGIEAVIAKDLNGDGFVDLVAANAKAETVELFIGSSTGLTNQRTIRGVPSPADLAVGDFNGDGLLDVAVANLYGSSAPYRLPSSATILELVVAERDVVLVAGQEARVDFGFSLRPTDRPVRTAEAFGFDVNRDGEVTPLDALLVLNSAAAQRGLSGGEGASAAGSKHRYKTDVNGDGQITPLDALLVLNRLASVSRGAAEAESAAGFAPVAIGPVGGEEDLLRRRREHATDAVFAGEGFLF